MICWLILLIRLVVAGLKSCRNLLLENLALRQQLLVLRRSSNRPWLTPIDRALWARLSQTWDGWKSHEHRARRSRAPATCRTRRLGKKQRNQFRILGPSNGFEHGLRGHVGGREFKLRQCETLRQCEAPGRQGICDPPILRMDSKRPTPSEPRHGI